MALREWPLVAFTLLGQAAVGGFLCLALPLFLAPRLAAPEGGRDARLVVTLAAAGLLAAALLAAFFHLGAPLNAWNALNNLRSSWLSREIFFLLLTFVLWGALALLFVLKARNDAAMKVMATAAGAAGVLFLFSMARIYMLPAVKAWNALFTPASFFLAAFLLGAAGGAAAASAGVLRLAPPHIRALLLAAVLLAAAGLAVSALAAPRFGLLGPDAPPGLYPPADPSLVFFIGRLVFLFAGAAVLVPQLKKAAGSSSAALPTVLTALFFFLAAEALGRFLFYASK
ncbi:MAG: hypothetical protein FJY83_06810 [Candidatus Aminicenantes bacterium]|nr:hypothetical protein [Candidatus Aminicenantes bacterium]